MTIRFVCALIFVSTLSSVAYPEGGTSGGDGGHGVLCDRKLSAPNRFSLELLDLYEARRLYPRDFSPVEPILGDQQTSGYDSFGRVASRLLRIACC